MINKAARSKGFAVGMGTTLAAYAMASSPRTAAAFGWGKPVELLEKNACIAGTESPIPDAPGKDEKHFLLGTPMYPPFPENMEMVSLGMGCFWCSENLFMRMPGVHSTHVGYAQGVTKNPSYEEVCSGRTNHNEVVRVVYDPTKITLGDILKVFWERHDPTTLNQQGNDRDLNMDKNLNKEIEQADEFYYAEIYHQQYDAKPGSRQYCGLSPLGTQFPSDSLSSATG
eukprot:jgi/Bigna1/83567/fgenesh1_pg.110_\